MDSHLETSGKGDAEEQTNLWETVLKEVGSSKTAATRKVLVLGDSNSGKTGVVTQLFQASLRPQFGNGLETANTGTLNSGLGDQGFSEIDSVVTLSKHDLALSYSYMDVRDEDNEETVARLGVYQLASDRTTDRELLRFVLDARSFSTSAAIVVLDWSKPWRFVKALLRWINVLVRAVEMVCDDTGGREATGKTSGWTQGRAAVDECRERLERFLQEYTEPSDVSAEHASAKSAGPGNVAASTVDVLLPLGKGVLEANLGIPLIIVCTKSDAMDVMERERGFKEEDFDYIQQVLRAVCLRFGAALIYTSTHNPATFSTLYHYLVHRLLTTPHTEAARLPGTEGAVPKSQQDIDADFMDVDVPHTPNPQQQSPQQQQQPQKSQLSYPFRVRANVVDRDVVFVPAGWDSVAKIGYLREPFDVHAVQGSWAADEVRYDEVVMRAIRESASVSDNSAMQPGCPDSLLQAFGQTVAAPKQRAGADADGSSTVAAVAAAAAGMANQVMVEDDQTFFERLYHEQQDQMAMEGEDAEEQANAMDIDGRSRTQGSSNKLISSLLRTGHAAESLSTANDSMSDDGIDDFDTSSISPSSFARQPTARPVPSIESSEAGYGSLGRSSGGRLVRGATMQASGAEGPPPALRRKLTLTAGGSGAAQGEGGSTNEDLTSFFQNLLGRKGGAATSSSTATSSTGKLSPQQPPAARPMGGSISRATGAGQKDVQADLERWKAQLKRAKE
ncbi:dynein light intermediate chain-domain-containing protein [Kickxella alabastrina]|uniref:dynein light intermediate chain-domain-containing protein n=1 Tax=Kickxella alabastrina TaxID=61397 RepID=UPI00221EFC35|nr:dynein light intermediate chain-domain-containing protein [Kickxella alabastrina]KAI7827258.1 dynein light intermediate chain-domain-containing protein [Kickxella alabastrina]